MKKRSINRLAIFLPRKTTFYLSLLQFIKSAFEKSGVQVVGMTQHLQEKEMLEFCHGFKPDVILEMNRTRNSIPFLPKEIKHVAWIVDITGNDLEQYQDSEIIYFFAAHWIRYRQKSKSSIVDWLAPGACTEHYYYSEQEAESDFSFVGHIPMAWDKNTMDRIVHTWPGGKISFGELYELCLPRWNSEDEIRVVNKRLSIAADIVKEISGENVCLDDPKLCYDLNCRAGRLAGRSGLINMVLSISESLRIYGSDSWASHLEYLPFYQGYLTDPSDIRTLYQSTRVNLHEGIGLHFRTFDCLASGGCLFYYQTPNDDDFGGINTVLEPGVDFVSFNKDNFADLAGRYLADKDAREKMAIRAAEVVRRHHSWDCRVKKILSDIQQVL